MRRNPIAAAVVVGVVASALGIVLALSIHWFPTQASSQLKDIKGLYDLLLILTVPIFVLVTTIVGFCIWQFRMKPGQELQDGPPIHGNTRLEIVWTAIPALLLVSVCSYAYAVLHDMEQKPAGQEMVVNVTGQQFAWNFEYPSMAQGKNKVAPPRLYLPVGESVQFKVRAVDVIHDFWVPNFGMKVDAVPGVTTSYRVTPTRIGTYPVVCAELCGVGHSTMRQSVTVLSKADFEAWAAKQKPAPYNPPQPTSGVSGAEKQ